MKRASSKTIKVSTHKKISRKEQTTA
jgi:hypothetical protein